MKISTFFLVLVAFFAFNTTILTQAQTCEPGLEQIPPMADSDYSSPGPPTWYTNGNQIIANQINSGVSGNLTAIKFVKGSNVSGTGAVKAVVYDSSLQKVSESAATNLTSTGFGGIDTVAIMLTTTIAVNPGDVYYVGVKFGGNNNRLLRNFDGASGTRLHVQNFFNEPFLVDISGIPTEDGLYAIWAIVEDCVTPIPGCMDNTACNYDPFATQDNGSCSYPAQFYDCEGSCLNDTDGDGTCDELEVLGCTDDTACNYDPFATESTLSCEWSCLTPCQRCDNGDGIITSSDLTIMLDVYGTFAQPGMDKRDLNEDGMHNTADLLSLLGCFGQIVE